MKNEASSISPLLFIVTHAPIGSSLLKAICDILPESLTNCILAFDITLNDDPEKKVHEAQQLLDTHHSEKILILTDLIGATPYNIARKTMQQINHPQCALISAISLPMLIKAVNYQSLPLEKWVAEITESVLEWVIIEFKRNHLK